MNPFKILVKCGYSIEEAVSKVGRRPSKIEMYEIGMIHVEERLERASANERKYSAIGPTAEDRLIDRIEGGRERTYDTIRDRHVCGIGKCKTNKAVLRRIKYGKGNIGKVGYLKQGFCEEEIPQ